MRNAIVHFASTHESVELSPYSLHGVADNGLNHTDAKRALTSAAGLVAEFFRLAGLSPPEVAGVMHSWAGKSAA